MEPRPRAEGWSHSPGLWTLYPSPPGTESDEHPRLIGKSNVPVFRTDLILTPLATGGSELLSACCSEIYERPLQRVNFTHIS